MEALFGAVSLTWGTVSMCAFYEATSVKWGCLCGMGTVSMTWGSPCRSTGVSVGQSLWDYTGNLCGRSSLCLSVSGSSGNLCGDRLCGSSLCTHRDCQCSQRQTDRDTVPTEIASVLTQRLTVLPETFSRVRRSQEG